MSYLTIDGINLSADDYGLKVYKDFDMPMLGEPRLNVQPLSQADGVAIQGSSIGAFTFSVPVVIVGSSDADCHTKAMNLINFFQTRMGTTYPLIWSERADQQYTVTLRSPINVRLAQAAKLFTLTFQDTNGYPETI